MRDLLTRCERHLEIAEKRKKPHEMAVTSREVRETLKTVALLTGELDQQMGVAVVFQQQQARPGEQGLMLEKLTLKERAERARLIAMAENSDNSEAAAAYETMSSSVVRGFETLGSCFLKITQLHRFRTTPSFALNSGAFRRTGWPGCLNFLNGFTRSNRLFDRPAK